MPSLLITQCLQEDFVKPLAHDEPLPNLLHIGHNESLRLLGADPNVGPINRFMEWAQQCPADTLAIIHVRDWHNPADGQQASHLHQFGAHCVANSVGSEFVFKLDPNRCAIVDSTTLNDFSGTNLDLALSNYVDVPIRVGLIGVWTEAKILFLAYELSTRYPHLKLAVCSALTASSSRSQHFLALQQLSRIVGVKIFDSIGEFSQFLTGASPELNLSPENNFPIRMDADISLAGEDLQLVNYLFRDSTRLQLKILDGGFSGNFVAGVTSFDIHGHEQAPHVIKIGPRELMAKERTAFEQIESVLGNNAPAVADYADLQRRGAIKYRYAAMGLGKTKSFQTCYQGSANQVTINGYLDSLFGEQLGRFYRAAHLESINLTKYYQFDPQWSSSIESHVTKLLGSCPDNEHLNIEGLSTTNVHYFYRQLLRDMSPVMGDFPIAFVHGDLNGANIIIDDHENLWLIDFFHTHRGHVLKDFAKLENDLLFIYTQIHDVDEFKAACRLTDFLLQHNHINPPPFEMQFDQPALDRAYQTIRHLRMLLQVHVPEVGSKVNLQRLLAQLRYAVHTLGFEEANIWQKKWALYAAGQYARQWISQIHGS